MCVVSPRSSCVCFEIRLLIGWAHLKKKRKVVFNCFRSVKEHKLDQIDININVDMYWWLLWPGTNRPILRLRSIKKSEWNTPFKVRSCSCEDKHSPMLGLFFFFFFFSATTEQMLDLHFNRMLMWLSGCQKTWRVHGPVRINFSRFPVPNTSSASCQSNECHCYVLIPRTRLAGSSVSQVMLLYFTCPSGKEGAVLIGRNI